MQKNSAASSSRTNSIVKKLNRWSKPLFIHPYWTLLAVFIIAFFIRLRLVLISGELPYIFRDEQLYMHIAESLHSYGEILIRGQSTAYTYILYPLVISPLFALPAGVNIFRAIQVENILLMQAAIFPAFALAHKITGSKKVSLGLAVLVLLMPDMTMVKNIMTESLSYPLILCAMYCIYLRFERPSSIGIGLLTGFLCFLLYWTKPVYIAVGGAAALVSAADALYHKDRAHWTGTACLIGAMAVAYGLSRGVLYVLLGVDAGQQTLYATQTASFSLDHVLQVLKGLQIYVYFHLIAFGILPIAALFSSVKRFEGPKKLVAWTLLLTVCFSLLCTVYIIYVDELLNQGGVPLRVHVRYAAVYFPVFLMFLMTDAAKGVKMHCSGVIALILIAIGYVAYPVSAIVSSANYPVDAMMMALMKLQSGAWDGPTMWLPIHLAIFLSIFVLAMRNGMSGKLRGVFFAAVIVSLTLNQYAAFRLDRNDWNEHYVADAEQVVEQLDSDAWMICRDQQECWQPAVAIDIAARCKVPVITLGDLIANTEPDGSVSAVKPTDMNEYVYAKAKAPYDAPAYLILDANILNTLALEQRARAVMSDNTVYATIPLEAGQPWIHSGFFGFNDNWVQEGSRFVLYNSALRAQDSIHFMFYGRSGEGVSTLTLTTSAGETYYFDMTTPEGWYEVTLAMPDSDEPFTIDFAASNGNVLISTYLVE